MIHPSILSSKKVHKPASSGCPCQHGVLQRLRQRFVCIAGAKGAQHALLQLRVALPALRRAARTGPRWNLRRRSCIERSQPHAGAAHAPHVAAQALAARPCAASRHVHSLHRTVLRAGPCLRRRCYLCQIQYRRGFDQIRLHMHALPSSLAPGQHWSAHTHPLINERAMTPVRSAPG